MRKRTLALMLVLGPVISGCAIWPRPPSPGIDSILQSEGTNPAQVPMYLLGKDGTFTTNGLTPLPWSDTQ